MKNVSQHCFSYKPLTKPYPPVTPAGWHAVLTYSSTWAGKYWTKPNNCASLCSIICSSFHFLKKKRWKLCWTHNNPMSDISAYTTARSHRHTWGTSIRVGRTFSSDTFWSWPPTGCLDKGVSWAQEETRLRIDLSLCAALGPTLKDSSRKSKSVVETSRGHR